LPAKAKILLMRLFLNNLLAPDFIPGRLRAAAFRVFFPRLGRNLTIGARCQVHRDLLEIGDNTFINYGVVLHNDAPIRIGANCDIGMDVLLCTASHEVGSANKRAGALSIGEIVIEDGCWLGARAIVMPSVTIGQGCIVAAGATVVRDCEPNGLYAGTPAKRVRDL
jgi:maltose O-acetyltransferase